MGQEIAHDHFSPEDWREGSELAVWSLTDPQTPVRVGTASLALGGRGVAFTYERSWLANGYPLSGDLPKRCCWRGWGLVRRWMS